MRPYFEHSAGGVVLSEGMVLLIRARDLRGRPIWTFPKGKLNKWEKTQDAALREVEEETGWKCLIEAELLKSRYWFQREGRPVHKTVCWFQMVPIALVGEHDGEVDEVSWLPVEEALRRLTYRSDRVLLRKAASSPDVPLPHPTETPPP